MAEWWCAWTRLGLRQRQTHTIYAFPVPPPPSLVVGVWGRPDTTWFRGQRGLLLLHPENVMILLC